MPDELLDKYGKLQKVKAEWYEYKTKPIYVTNNQNAYTAFKAHVGEHVGSTYNETIGYGLGFNQKVAGGSGPSSVWYYQDAFNLIPFVSGVSRNYIDAIYYIFYKPEIESGETVVTGEELEQYIKDYGPGTAQLPIKDGTISADLFEDYVDSERTRGKNVAEIDANDKFNMLAAENKVSFWEALFKLGIFKESTTDKSYMNIPPIYAVTADDLQKDADALSSSLLIDKTDVADFKAYAAAAEAKGQTTHLFRFAQTDYYSEMGGTKIKYDNTIDSPTTCDAMRAQQTVFYDFTVISLTFSKDGVYKVIPAANSPIDIINDVRALCKAGITAALKAVRTFLIRSARGAC